jgi:hypothetical protein
MTDPAADPAPQPVELERPCRACCDGDHGRCSAWFSAEFGNGECHVIECCCDALEQEPELPRWHP